MSQQLIISLCNWMLEWRTQHTADPRVYVLCGAPGVGKTFAANKAAEGVLYTYSPHTDEKMSAIRTAACNMSVSGHTLILLDNAEGLDIPKDILAWPNPVVVCVNDKAKLPKFLQKNKEVKFIEVNAPSLGEKLAFWNEKFKTAPDMSIIAKANSFTELYGLGLVVVHGGKPLQYLNDSTVNSADSSRPILDLLAGIKRGESLPPTTPVLQTLWWMYDNCIYSGSSLHKMAWADAQSKRINAKYINAVLSTCRDISTNFPYSAGLRKKKEPEAEEEKIKVVNIKLTKAEQKALAAAKGPSLNDF